MKKTILAILAMLAVFAAGCSATDAPAKTSNPPVNTNGLVEITFSFNRQSGIAANQFAVWIEDGGGKFIKTLFATNFTAKGGYAQRPESLPVWVKKSEIAGNKAEADVISGATPSAGELKYIWDCTDRNGAGVPDGEYTFFVEGTVFWEDMLYKGAITVGDAPSEAQAPAEVKPSKDSDMIGTVKAAFTPPEK